MKNEAKKIGIIISTSQDYVGINEIMCLKLFTHRINANGVWWLAFPQRIKLLLRQCQTPSE